jgi:hypothetical protein
MPIVTTTAMIALVLTTCASAQAQQPGQVDFGIFSPPASGGEFVEVNLSSNIISVAAHFLPKEEAEISKLLSGLHHIRVNVIGLDDQNRADITNRIQKVRTTLAAQGWERIVNVQEKSEDVGIYMKMHDKDTIAGLTVVVLDGKKEAVFVNIVGNIKADQLAVLGERLHIDPLKKIGRGLHKENASAK